MSSDRVEALLREVAELHRAEVRKVEPASFSARPYMVRAKKAFERAVEDCGGASAVARMVPCDESNIRLQIRHPDRSPLLSVVYSLEDPDAMEAIAEDIKAVAAAKRAVRRAG